MYRVVHFPAGEHEDLAALWLWSEQQGIFSHETALMLQDRQSHARLLLQVGCMIFGSAKGFPTDASAALQRLWCPIAGVACFHDENKNGKLDTGLFGIPKEGTVVSNHAKGFLGPPSFDKAKFSFAGTLGELQLRMGY